jgi:hypothetical protein
LAKLATPLEALAVTVPLKVELPGFVPIEMVMLALELVTVLPFASRTVTCTAGEMFAPAAVLVGCTVKASWVAAPGVMLNVDDVAPVRPLDAALSV